MPAPASGLCLKRFRVIGKQDLPARPRESAPCGAEQPERVPESAGWDPGAPRPASGSAPTPQGQVPRSSAGCRPRRPDPAAGRRSETGGPPPRSDRGQAWPTLQRQRAEGLDAGQGARQSQPWTFASRRPRRLGSVGRPSACRDRAGRSVGPAGGRGGHSTLTSGPHCRRQEAALPPAWALTLTRDGQQASVQQGPARPQAPPLSKPRRCPPAAPSRAETECPTPTQGGCSEQPLRAPPCAGGCPQPTGSLPASGLAPLRRGRPPPEQGAPAAPSAPGPGVQVPYPSTCRGALPARQPSPRFCRPELCSQARGLEAQLAALLPQPGERAPGREARAVCLSVCLPRGPSRGPGGASGPWQWARVQGLGSLRSAFPPSARGPRQLRPRARQWGSRGAAGAEGSCRPPPRPRAGPRRASPTHGATPGRGAQ